MSHPCPSRPPSSEHAAAHPGAPRLGVGDLSRPRGGRFGPEYGGDGHRSHQNRLDVDVYHLHVRLRPAAGGRR
jgi:murein endopeptidase